MKVFRLPNEPHHEDFQEFRHAVEVRSSNGLLIQRWTYRSEEHADREYQRIQELFRPPAHRGGTAVIPC